MRLAVIFVVAFASTASAEDLDSQLATTSRWELTAAAGISTTSVAMPGMQLMSGSARAVSGMPGMTDTSAEPSALFALRYRITDRVLWSIPTLSFAYLGGTAEREWIPWGGLTSWGAGYSSIEHFIGAGELGAGAGLREWLATTSAVNFTASVASQFQYTSSPICPVGGMCRPSWITPDTWRATVTAGASHRVGTALTLNLGIAGSQRLLYEGGPASGSDERGMTVAIGSVQTIGLRLLPLVQAHVSPRWSIDGYAAAAYDLSRERFEQTYLVGVTRVWPTPAQ
jgi:hypothetical protein